MKYPKHIPLQPTASSRRTFLATTAKACGTLVLGSGVAPFLRATEAPAPFNSLAKSFEVNYREFPLDALPAPLHVLSAAGVVASKRVNGTVLHNSPVARLRAKGHLDGVWDVTATVTPAGDYLVMFPEGAHYARQKTKLNRMVAYRSRDHGLTWEGPTVPYQVDYNEHGFMPLIPRGSKRLYSFGTQPIWSRFQPEGSRGEDAPIGFRWSDDDGHNWSPVEMIRPTNDPEFMAMSRTRMCETEKGVWVLGAHAGDWSKKPLVTWQYILRSEDRGITWQVVPGPRPKGWQCPGFGRMDETRCLSLGGERVLALARTPEGHLWEFRSEDAGLTWTVPSATTLVHPDAPAMLYQLSDGQTLMALHHNRSSADRLPMQDRAHLGVEHPGMRDRAQIWLSLSTDEGITWEKPRFVFCNATIGTPGENSFIINNCSYTDALIDHGTVHLFVPHQWRRILHLHVAESDLRNLPTAADLGA